MEEILKEVTLLSDKKAFQTSDIPVKIIRENNIYLITYFILHNFNIALSYKASLELELELEIYISACITFS